MLWHFWPHSFLNCSRTWQTETKNPLLTFLLGGADSLMHGMPRVLTYSYLEIMGFGKISTRLKPCTKFHFVSISGEHSSCRSNGRSTWKLGWWRDYLVGNCFNLRIVLIISIGRVVYFERKKSLNWT